MGIIDCSVAEYEMLATTGCIKTVEEYVENLFPDGITIAHCKDNNVDYNKREAGELVAFIESRL